MKGNTEMKFFGCVVHTETSQNFIKPMLRGLTNLECVDPTMVTESKKVAQHQTRNLVTYGSCWIFFAKEWSQEPSETFHSAQLAAEQWFPWEKLTESVHASASVGANLSSQLKAFFAMKEKRHRARMVRDIKRALGVLADRRLLIVQSWTDISTRKTQRQRETTALQKTTAMDLSSAAQTEMILPNSCQAQDSKSNEAIQRKLRVSGWFICDGECPI